MGHLKTELRARTSVITIENRERANAFTQEMATRLLEHLRSVDADPRVRCVIITGGGDRAFSTGHELAEVQADYGAAAGAEANAVYQFPRQMRTPVIAAVNGAAYGAGLMLALSAPVRIASEHATFCASGARLGLVPVGGQLSELPRVVAPAVAAEMLLTSQPLGAVRAYELGLISRLAASPTDLLPCALDVAASIEAASPRVVAAVLDGLRQQRELGSLAAAGYEEKITRELEGHPDVLEGLDAFFARRTPQFVDSSEGRGGGDT